MSYLIWETICRCKNVTISNNKFVQVINSDWDGHKLSYDLAILFTGRMNFVDGMGHAYIGGICQQ